MSRPPATAPPTAAAIPMAPSQRPLAADMIVFETAKTQRAGWAVREATNVPCCASEVNSGIPVTAANTAVSTVE